ncbi:MAG: DNA-binding protein [Steroidobacteraceae bacterium]
MHSENDEDGSGIKGTFTGRDILYRQGTMGVLDVQRAADALLRQGRKPSVAAIREHLGGGSPNTITPLLAKYWEKLGSRLGDEPESLERVPEALVRVTELLWRRAIEEARERLKLLQSPEAAATGVEELQEQVGKLSITLAEARAREGEQLTYLSTLSTEREALRVERGSLLALLKSSQELLRQQNARVTMLEGSRAKQLSVLGITSRRSRTANSKGEQAKPTRVRARPRPSKRKIAKARKPK